MSGRETPPAMRYLDKVDDAELNHRLRTRKRFFDESPLSQVEIGSRDCDVTPFSFDPDKENSPGCPFSPAYGLFTSSIEKHLENDGPMPHKIASLLAFGDDPALASLVVNPKIRPNKGKRRKRRAKAEPLTPFDA